LRDSRVRERFVKILALDTATENCSAALVIQGTVRMREEFLGRGHAARILSMVGELLDEAGVKLPALDAVAFGRGPGAFTGVRLAASVTQGLAFGSGLLVVPVSDLRALAQRALNEDTGLERVLVCTDARMREVYCGAFERGRDGLALSVYQERVTAPEEVSLPEHWTEDERARALGAGSGFAVYPALAPALAGRLGGVREQLWPRALEIAQLAEVEVAAQHTLPPAQALPVYLRNDVAQVPPAAPKSLI
jgi:tRNA threonylcarbamoyladenosine biosynthesis protein TsaB